MDFWQTNDKKINYINQKSNPKTGPPHSSQQKMIATTLSDFIITHPQNNTQLAAGGCSMVGQG
jgi:hypothetical protein